MPEVPPLLKPVLVTGAAGFIGRRLVDRLLADGNTVIAFDLPGVPTPPAWAGPHSGSLR